MSPENVEEFSSQIGRLCEENKIEEAKELKQHLFGEVGAHNNLYAEVAGYFYLAGQYDEVRNIFKEFQKKTGMKLRADFTWEDVLEKQASVGNTLAKVNTRDSVEFIRMSFWKRGHFSNRFRLFPPLSICITRSKIIIKNRLGEFCCKHEDVDGVDLIYEDKSKAYGRGVGIKYTRKTLVIGLQSRKFWIDVSNQFPDFYDSKLLEQKILAIYQVNVIDKRKR